MDRMTAPPADTPFTRPEQAIPAPAHLSEGARQFLASCAAAPRIPEPAGGSMEEWDAAAAGFDERILPQIEPLVASIPMDMESIVVGACTVRVASPPGLNGAASAYALMDIHGGGLVFGSGRLARCVTIARAAALGCRVFGVDYRVPPRHPYPAALDDCLSAYRYLLERHPPGHIVVAGLSAGGNLAAATILRARDEGLPLPAAAILLTPELDLTESGDSFHVMADVDVALPVGLPRAIAVYADGQDLAHPYLSPLFADLTGFPPCFLQTGTRDLYLSNTVRMHRALLRAGRQAELHVWEAMPHAGFGGLTPEDVEVQVAMREFLVRVAGWRL